MTHTHDHNCDDNHHINHLDRNIIISIFLNTLIVIAEIIGGLMSSSLALISDAMHNFSDVAALLIAYAARRFSRRLPSVRHTYGYGRFEVLAALLNSATLLIVLTLILREAISRLVHPQPIRSGIMLVIALIGLFANLGSVFLLKSHSHDDINMRSAFLHLLQDTLSSVAVVIAAWLSEWNYGAYFDPAVSVIVALFVVRSGWGILQESLHILMESTPRGLDLETLQKDIQSSFPILNIHHMHSWEMIPGYRVLTAHIKIHNMPLCDCEALRREIHNRLNSKWSIDHATLEVELDECATPDLLDLNHAQK
jgi:cobalt-zinc-cadmium efflux system protein